MTTDRQVSPAVGEFAMQENVRLRAENAKLREALRECVEACRSNTHRSSSWTGSMRCPNPVIDGPKFALAESLLAKEAA